jgi:hypothetical protein
VVRETKQMDSDQPSIRGFVAAFRGEWFAAMSGGFSVPFVFLAAFVDNKYGQLILLSLAFSGAWFAAYRLWKAEREKVISYDCKKQGLLNDIAVLRERVGKMRIDMERDIHARNFNEKHWETKFDELQNDIASKIELFSSPAEAMLYRHRGNLQRPINTNMGGFLNERLVDLCIHDLDYLRQLIQDFSRNKKR